MAQTTSTDGTTDTASTPVTEPTSVTAPTSIATPTSVPRNGNDISREEQTIKDMSSLGDALARLMGQLDDQLTKQRSAILDMVILATNTASSILMNSSSKREGKKGDSAKQMDEIVTDIQAKLNEIAALKKKIETSEGRQPAVRIDASVTGPISAEESAAIALGNLYQTTAEMIGMAMQNAIAAQQQINTISQAALAQAVALLLNTPTYAYS